MKIAISGIHGLIGSSLKDFFLKNGHQVNEISRHRGGKKSSNIFIDLKRDYVDSEALEGHDIIIHLAGANISRSWSASYKKEILESRVRSTNILVNAIKGINSRPKIFLCASAVGYYGTHDPEIIVNERNLSGLGFLADVCQEWENASADLILLGVRLVHMRFGVVLSKKGGALAKMKIPFYCGLGGRLGSGSQKMSWIAIDEIPRIIEFIVGNDKISGAVNFVSPHTVTNHQFTKILGSVIHRPTFLPFPGFVLKVLLGEMGQKLLLEGVHVTPQVLLDAGYRFEYPDLKEALQKVL